MPKAKAKPKSKSAIPDNVKNKALYSRVKSEAKRKFDVYPSAYANIWASKYCKGKVGRTKKADGGFIARGCGKVMSNRRKKTKMV